MIQLNLKKSYVFLFVLTLLFSSSCTKKESNVDNNSVHTNDTIKSTTKPTVDLIQTKWIIGEEGLNGEKPDTLHFISKTKLRYVSTDTGLEILDYVFKNDTLKYSYTSSEYNLDLDKDIDVKTNCKLVLKNNKFYIFYVKTKINNRDTIYDLSKTHYFTKIK